MYIIQARVNDALNINPPAGDQRLSVHGSNWLWAVTAIYIISFVCASVSFLIWRDNMMY